MSTLDNFKTEARRWLKALRAGDAAARQRLERAYPAAPPQPTLRDVQHALAREHGCVSWIALRERLATASMATTPLDDLLAAASKQDAARVAAVLDSNPHIVNDRGALGGHTGLRTALHFGIHSFDVVQTLLARGANPNIRDEGDNAMPLHFAVERGDLRVVRLLVEHGADVIGTGDGHELEVIGWATCFGNGDPELVDYLLAHGAVHNIFSAVAMGDAEAIRAIAKRSPADVNRAMDRTNRRRRPLHLAVVKKQMSSLIALLDVGADLDATDASGLTPLDQAALYGEQAMADLLIERGAAVGVPAAVGLGRIGDLELLLRNDPGCLSPEGRWAHLIVRAAERAPGAVIELLIKRGASVDAVDAVDTAVDGAGGYTALHAAAWNGNEEAAAMLLKYGANPTVRDDKYCATPAGWARYAGHTAVCDVILQGPIDVFDAIDHGKADRIPDILDRDPDALTRRFGAYASCGDRPNRWWPLADQSPLSWAVEKQNAKAVQILTERGADAAAHDGDIT